MVTHCEGYIQASFAGDASRRLNKKELVGYTLQVQGSCQRISYCRNKFGHLAKP